MLRHLLHHVLSSFLTFFILVTLCFFIVRLSPGSPLATDDFRGAAGLRQREEREGFHKPLYDQLADYFSRLRSGSLGKLYTSSGSVEHELCEHVPPSLKFGSITFAFAVCAGIALGWLSAIYQNTWVDYLISVTSNIIVNIPAYIRTPFILIFCVRWLKMRTLGYQTAGFPIMFLPVFATALGCTIIISRQVRAALITVLHENYFRAARAKGLPKAYLLLNHAILPALVPFIPYLAPLFSDLLMGSVISEAVFSLPGMGDLMIKATRCREYHLIMALVMVWGGIRLGLSLLAEVLVIMLSPKIKRSVQGE